MVGFIVDQNPFAVLPEDAVNNSLNHGGAVRINPHGECGFPFDLAALQHPLPEIAPEESDDSVQSDHFCFVFCQDARCSHPRHLVADYLMNVGAFFP